MRVVTAESGMSEATHSAVMPDLDDAWSDVHVATPPGWYVGRREGRVPE
jgi:hypothetical protein